MLHGGVSARPAAAAAATLRRPLQRSRRVAAAQAAGVRSTTHAAPDGAALEVLFATADRPASGAAAADRLRPPLLFLHGSAHAAWCWAEHFLPHFAAAGYDAYALSLRGHVRTAAVHTSVDLPARGGLRWSPAAAAACARPCLVSYHLTYVRRT